MALCTIIDFSVTCETNIGETVVIVGDHADFGKWDESSGLALATDKESYPVWTSKRPLLLKVPEGLEQEELQYKVTIVKEKGENVYEEISANRRIKVSAKAAGMATTIAMKYGESEKDATCIPKFSPPARGSTEKPKEKKAEKAEEKKEEPKEGEPARSASNSSLMEAMKRVETGCGLEYMMQAADEEDKHISFWHDIPLFPVDENDQPLPFHANFVCEIPKTTRKKFEINTKAVGNPIKQDQKNGKPREYSKGDIWFNYGCLPRTWEDTDFIHPDVGFPGDGDPLDACEIGMRMFETGEVRTTKILGVICMIDEDETDWKLICIDVEDRWASELNDVSDVDRLLPGCLDQIREWWRTYKVTDGKPLNKFGLDEKFMPKEYAMDVIFECHDAWRQACKKVSDSEKEGASKPKKTLSFSKLEDLDLTTDQAALDKLSGA